MSDWRNRIVGHGEESPEQLAANPRNWRIHPERQQRVLEGSINDVGFIRSVTVNKRTGYVLDGHLRVSLAISSGQSSVPVEYVDLSEAEEAEALATLDPITALAVTDGAQLQELMADVNNADAAVDEFLAEMADGLTVPGEDDWAAALGGLPDGDKGEFQQMTFTLHDSQAEEVRGAMETAKGMGPFDSPNENSNGNALARICEMFNTQHG